METAKGIGMMGRVSDMAIGLQEGVDELLCEIDHWKERADEAEGLLRVVMQWIENWDPNFIYDDDWPETQAIIRAFLEAKS